MCRSGVLQPVDCQEIKTHAFLSCNKKILGLLTDAVCITLDFLISSIMSIINRSCNAF